MSHSLTSKAANTAFAQDVGAGRAQHTATTSAPSPASASSSQKPRKSGGISDYSTPESLGYTDPEIDRVVAEAERRRTMGVAGDWHIVESAPTESPTGTGEESTQHGDDIQNPEDNQETNKKRAVPDPAEEERGRWKLRKKTTAVGLGEIYDPGVFAIKLKTKAEVKEEDTSQAKEPSGDANATALPKWAPVKWKKAGEPADDARGEVSSGLADGDTALTEGKPQVIPDPSDADLSAAQVPVADIPMKVEPLPVKLEEAVTPSGEATSSGGSLFRKRKAPVGGGTGIRGRRL